MTPAEIKEVVELTIQGRPVVPWWSYLIFLVIVGASAYVGTYIRIKAQNLATKEDFKSVLSQLKIQVAATEQIKTEISFGNWKNQEWNSVRRAKLEELVRSAFNLRKIARDDIEKLGRNLNEKVSTQFDIESDAILNLEMLTALYFPELRIESLRVNINFRTYQQEVLKSNSRAKELIRNSLVDPLTPRDTELLDNLNANIPSLHSEFNDALNGLISKAEKVLLGIMQTDSHS